MNFGLAVFNLLPVGPLDGGGILRGFLPPRAAAWFDASTLDFLATSKTQQTLIGSSTMLLRGTDSFFLWCMEPENVKEVELLHPVWAAAQAYGAFLDKGTPVNFEVPGTPGSAPPSDSRRRPCVSACSGSPSPASSRSSP